MGKHMPAYVVDLHNHTPHLDTDYRGPADTSPDDVIRAAVDAGIDVLGATDHFCADYVQELADAARRHADETGRQLLILGGAELKLRHGPDEVHLVALFEADEAHESLERIFEEFGAGCCVLKNDKLPALVSAADPIEVARAVRDAGGVAVAGHVDRAFGEYRLTDSSYFIEVVYSGCFDAIEIVEEPTLEWLQSMSTPALIASSDAHAPAEMGRRRTFLAAEDLTFAAVKEGLRRGSTVPLLESAAAEG